MGPAVEIQTFDKFTLLGQRWFFRIVDCGNSEILAASQTYKTKAQRGRTANRLAYYLGCAVVAGKLR